MEATVGEDSVVNGILGLGEERMSEVVGQLLANERFASALQNAFSGGLEAKRSVDKNLARLYGLANVPTLEDLDQVREKMDEVEGILEQIQARADELLRAQKQNKAATKKKTKKKTTKKKK